MDDLIYRQEAIAALGERPMSWTDSDYELGSRNRFDMDRLAIDTVPPVDAVPVVRCGECKHLSPFGRCSEFADYHIRPSSSDFCSYGERKDAVD